MMATILCLDCEWNGFGGELLSIALVSPCGREWYEVVEFSGVVDPWVYENVLPILRKPAAPLTIVRASLESFLYQFAGGVHIVADWPEDIERFCALLVSGPGQRIDTPPLTMEIVRVDCESTMPHNALCDARGIRDRLFNAASGANGKEVGK